MIDNHVILEISAASGTYCIASTVINHHFLPFRTTPSISKDHSIPKIPFRVFESFFLYKKLIPFFLQLPHPLHSDLVIIHHAPNSIKI
mmetsp:Transcript_36800/g.76587  ORF Transcript_36800/g.76587 Transcript_36800/m.76587 type:complete len:88 (-) Transcript_36800:91-354(-)